VLDRLTRNLAAGDILLLHDGITARLRDCGAQALAVLPALAARLAAHALQPVTLREACRGDAGG
jgi:hypothetical protein